MVAQTLTPEEIAYVALAYGKIMASQVPIAVAVALAESGGNTHAHNSKPPDDSYGLWQINMYGTLGPARRKIFKIEKNEDLFMVQVNAAAMAHISIAGAKWSDWTTYTDGKYKQHLPKAQEAAKKVGFPANPLYDPTKRLQDTDAQANRNPLEQLIAWVSQGVLRGAGFVGGGVLVIIAIILYVRAKK